MWCIHSTTPISKNKCSRFHTTNVIKCVGDKVAHHPGKTPYNLSWDLYNPTKTIILSWEVPLRINNLLNSMGRETHWKG